MKISENSKPGLHLAISLSLMLLNLVLIGMFGLHGMWQKQGRLESSAQLNQEERRIASKHKPVEASVIARASAELNGEVS